MGVRQKPVQDGNPGLEWSILDALDVHVVLLDKEGVILQTNRAWDDFAAQNPGEGGAIPKQVGLGANYLVVCQAASGASAENAYAAYRGIRDVLTGKKRLFTLEYPCHSPFEQRWFVMKVTALKGAHPRQVVVVHTNVTALRKAELEMQRKTRELTLALESLENFAGQLKNALKLDQSIRGARDRLDPSRTPLQQASGHREAEGLKLLSKREQEVLLALTRGERNTEIAARLDLSVKSVSTYRSRVLEKLQVKSTAELVSFMHRNGLG